MASDAIATHRVTLPLSLSPLSVMPQNTKTKAHAQGVTSAASHTRRSGAPAETLICRTFRLLSPR